MGQAQIIGAILGTAVGDAIGLPYEGLSRRRGAKLLGTPDRHRLLFGFGMVSDDTEHTCIVAQSLIAAGGDVTKFQQQLARRLRWWLLSLPAGVGLATLRSILKLWLGFSPDRSGVFSAGNGPAMRAAIIGVAIADPVKLKEFVRVASRITHTDPKAEYGAFAIALAAQNACKSDRVSGDDFLFQLSSDLGTEADELLLLIKRAIDSVKDGDSTVQFANSMGLTQGVSGYVYHSVPVAIHAWLSNQDNFKRSIIETVECGGDTDSIAAMVGGITGASVGKDGIPVEWLNKLIEPFLSVDWMERLSKQLALSLETKKASRSIKLPIIAQFLRNICFLLVVLTHGFRRLLPPY
ncbi:ADP-ribosylglycohydrolase family protein [Chamaesiphon polymorphus]|uniref:Dinitrogenase reductase n=1 Tax=Chamaesiphon polymorphus CCALA 037 TaxID=2107692 RepID=A0A2T1GHV6_9CYAN|nr:ADP-ribosylglycohydrolase family protein [Chamaesiphon polymorphus]PSB57297.1 dinitrogenase reductase [Chamaesiphon polymorphus CCALA 037]